MEPNKQRRRSEREFGDPVAGKDFILHLLQGVRGLEESSTYQAILAEGALAEARKLLLRFGKKRLGNPSESTRQAIDLIEDLERLEQLLDRVVDVSDWDALLRTKRRQNGR